MDNETRRKGAPDPEEEIDESGEEEAESDPEIRKRMKWYETLSWEKDGEIYTEDSEVAGELD